MTTRLHNATLALACAAAIVAGCNNQSAKTQERGGPVVFQEDNANTDPLAPNQHMDVVVLVDFSLTDQDGNTVDQSIAHGGLTVLDFFFSRCPGVCVPMGNNMRHAQQTLEGLPVRFVSVSVDPARDTPERLWEYATEKKADTETWSFLTGPREVTDAMIAGFKMAGVTTTDETFSLPDGTTGQMLSHPSYFVLLGPTGETLGLYHGTDRADVDKLIERCKAAAKKLPRP